MQAAVLAGLEEIPIDAIECDDATAVKLSHIENSRRRSLNALDEAEEIMYLLCLTLEKDRDEVKRLLYQFKNAAEGNASIDPQVQATVIAVFEEVASEISVSAFAASRLPLLELPLDVMEAYRSNRINLSAAILLGRVDDEDLRGQLIEEVANGLSVIQLKSRLRPKEARSVSGGLDKLRAQVEKIVPEKLSEGEKEEVRDRLLALQGVLKKKLKEIL
jgi:ParB family chromosome partitioning protein